MVLNSSLLLLFFHSLSFFSAIKLHQSCIPIARITSTRVSNAPAIIALPGLSICLSMEDALEIGTGQDAIQIAVYRSLHLQQLQQRWSNRITGHKYGLSWLNCLAVKRPRTTHCSCVRALSSASCIAPGIGQPANNSNNRVGRLNSAPVYLWTGCIHGARQGWLKAQVHRPEGLMLIKIKRP